MHKGGEAMLVAITGATGFLGQYIVRECLRQGWNVRAWTRSGRIPAGLDTTAVEWIAGDLSAEDRNDALLHQADVVIHAAFEKWKGSWFSPDLSAADNQRYLQSNLLHSLRLIDDARRSGVARFIFVSSAAVYGRILADRPLDETHPLWPSSPYGACKASIEAFIAGIAAIYDWPICAVRPPSIYGLAERPRESKFHEVVDRALKGLPIDDPKGAKQVHASDVAKAIKLLIHAPVGAIKGEAFNCYDRFISDDQVADLVQQITGQTVAISHRASPAKNIIDTRKIQSLGLKFGGEPLLEQTVRELIESIERKA